MVAAAMRGDVVAGEDARLQLADPVQAGGDRQARLVRPAAARTAASSNPASLKRAEYRRQPAERPDQPELRGDEPTTRPNRA